jgi:hypothetical protein
MELNKAQGRQERERDLPYGCNAVLRAEQSTWMDGEKVAKREQRFFPKFGPYFWRC